MKRVSFHELAEREVNDTALYYEKESKGLGIRFLDEIERYIDGIVKNPDSGRKVRGQVPQSVRQTYVIRDVHDDGCLNDRGHAGASKTR